MNKLYIYGCSFSDVYLPDLYEKGWWELLADHFDIRYENRGGSGYGWHRIRHRLFSDSLNWTPEDLLIVCPSFFGRVDIVEMNVDAPDFPTEPMWISYVDDWEKRYEYTEKDWSNVVNFLHKIGLNVYTWVIDPVKYTSVPEKCLIHPPGNFKGWWEWELSDPANWIVPYRHRCDNGEWLERDAHFSDSAHIKVADTFIKHITRYENI